MPEISEAEYRSLMKYTNLGTPEDIQKKINDLETDNRKYRQDTIPALEAKVPKEDEVVVKKADADRLEKVKELGKPEEIKAKLTEGEQSKKELLILKRTNAARVFAKAAGLADEAVDTMIAIPALEQAEFTVKKETVKDQKTGKDVEAEVAYVVLPTEDGKSTETLNFEKAKEKVPALKGLRMAEPGKPQDRGGLNFVPQGGGEGGSKGGTVFDQIRQQREEEQKKRQERQTTGVNPLEKQFGVKTT